MTDRTIDLSGPAWAIEFPDRTNPELIAAAKLAGGRWHSARRRWEVAPGQAAAAALRHLVDDHQFCVTGGDLAALSGDQRSLATLATALDYPLEQLLDETPPEVHHLIQLLKPHQRAGLAYILRAVRVLVADEMGLGKTIEVLVALAVLDTWPVVVAVPRKLVSNWCVEALRWLRPGTRIAAVLPPSVSKAETTRLLARGVGAHVGAPRRGAQLYVVPYSVLGSQAAHLAALRPRGLVLDESHTCKTPLRHLVCPSCGSTLADTEGQTHCKGSLHHAVTVDDARLVYRTRVVAAAKELSEPVLEADGPAFAVSGTPNKNKPTDLIAQLDIIGHLDALGGRQGFVNRHAHGVDPDEQQRTRRRRGGHLDELHARLLATCMLRRRTKDVLPDIGVDRRVLLVDLEPEGAARYEAAAADVLAYLAARAAEIAEREGLDPRSAALRARFKAEGNLHLVRIGVLLKIAAEAKVPLAIEWAQDFLRETDRKLIVFAHNHSVLRPIADALDAPRIDGTTGDAEPVKERFQNDPDCRVVVIGITAGGVGLTLTAAEDQLFVQTGWTPGDESQAEARSFGRVNDAHSIRATYMVAAGTEDEWQRDLIDQKREEADAVTDGEDMLDVDLSEVWIDRMIDAAIDAM